MNDADGGGKGWLVNPLGHPITLDWARDGDEWQRRLTQLITARSGSTGFRAKSIKEHQLPGLAFGLDGTSLVSELWAVPLKQGMLLLVSGTGEATEDQIEPWATAAVEALQALGSAEPQPWVAIVGCQPAGIAHSPGKAISGEIEVAGLRLSPVGHRLAEWRPPSHPALHQMNSYVSHPVVVRGSAEGYDWWRASQGAFDDLHRLCSLLSVAMDECWVVREAPMPDDGRLITLPEEIGFSDGPGSEAGGSYPPPTSVELPDWMERGMERARTDAKFAHRLAGFQEGMEAQSEHPSLAAVAFVAVIESIGAMLRPLRRCDACGSLAGSTKAFKQALRVVLSEQDATLLDATYGVRSKTAHEGRLHGSESRFGMTTGPTFWGDDPVFAFEWRQLWNLRKAARGLLELDLAGALPSPAPAAVVPASQRPVKGRRGNAAGPKAANT